MSKLHVTHFTDPACPFAFSAEPQRLKLLWHYGDQIELENCMIVLAETAPEPTPDGFTPEKMAKAFAGLQDKYGMPIDTSVRPRMQATIPACRAVVATRVHGQPGDEERLLRALRVHYMGNDGLLDEPGTLERAAKDAGLDFAELQRWVEDPKTEERLREDMKHSRTPNSAALALGHKLSPAESPSGKRYSAPSLELGEHGPEAVALPGFQPFESYDSAIANILQDAALRRPKPDSVDDVLSWAPYPLATAEVAALREIPAEKAREELAEVADFRQVGEDGYWTARVGSAS